jgi:hypothetical protein
MDEKTAGSHIESIPFTEDEFYMKRSGRERQDSDRNYSLPLWVRGTASAVDEVVVGTGQHTVKGYGPFFPAFTAHFHRWHPVSGFGPSLELEPRSGAGAATRNEVS